MKTCWECFCLLGFVCYFGINTPAPVLERIWWHRGSCGCAGRIPPKLLTQVGLGRFGSALPAAAEGSVLLIYPQQQNKNKPKAGYPWYPAGWAEQDQLWAEEMNSILAGYAEAWCHQSRGDILQSTGVGFTPKCCATSINFYLSWREGWKCNLQVKMASIPVLGLEIVAATCVLTQGTALVPRIYQTNIHSTKKMKEFCAFSAHQLCWGHHLPRVFTQQFSTHLVTFPSIF